MSGCIVNAIVHSAGDYGTVVMIMMTVMIVMIFISMVLLLVLTMCETLTLRCRGHARCAAGARELEGR